MTKPLVVAVALLCLQGYLWNAALAMPQESFRSLWLADTSLNHEPEHRSDVLCAGQPDGFYPNEGCTGNYFACFEQIFYPQVCPGPGSLFDPVLLKCVSAGTASCITTIPPPTTIKPFSCPSDGFYPIGACSTSYYICIGTDIYPQTCPGGGVFEPSLLTCVSADTAPCKATTTTSTTTMPTTTILPPFTCTADGFYEIAPCMQTYYICIGGVKYPETCPGTGIFVGPPSSACKRPEETTCFQTTQPSVSEAATSEAATSEAATSEAATSVAATSEATTSVAATSEAATSEAATSVAATSVAATSVAATSVAATSEAPTTIVLTTAGAPSACTCSNGATTCYQPLNPNTCIKDYYTCYQGSLYPQTCPYPNIFDPVRSTCTGPSNASCNQTTIAPMLSILH